VVTLYGRKLTPIKEQIGPEFGAQLNSRQLEILTLIEQRGKIASAECARRFKITRDTANRDFRKLMELGLIVKRGSGRGTHYVLRGAV